MAQATLLGMVDQARYALKRSQTLNGGDAHFIPLDANWGFKWWRSLTEARENLIVQSFLHTINCAPAIGSNLIYFEYKSKHGIPLQRWGFVTEFAEAYAYSGLPLHWRQTHEGQELEDKLDKNGVHFGDNHCHNVGFLRGKLVVIDTGCVSITDKQWSLGKSLVGIV